MPYDVGVDPYSDPDTGVLRNLLDINDKEELEQAEASLTSVEIVAILDEKNYSLEEINWELILYIHEQLFSDLYDWAGKVRTVEIHKDTTRFAFPDHIEINGRKILKGLADENYLINLDDNEFAHRLAHYYSELNVLHPFREGNGRTIRTFLSILASVAGWHIHWEQMDSQENIVACIEGYQGDEAPLTKMLKRLIEPIDPFRAKTLMST